MTMTLVIGNKNYSSWSLRGWLAVKATGQPFKEIMIPLDRPETRAAIAEHAPSGLVPTLTLGGVTVWDSLAILETLAERFPGTGLWPEDKDARAVARAVTAEMHAGFRALREAMPMNIRGVHTSLAPDEATLENIQRIKALWRDCRARFGAQASPAGPYLFGAWCGADIAYAPVVTRFRTYGVLLENDLEAYASAVLAQPDMAQWCRDAETEPHVVHKYDTLLAAG